MDAVTGGGISLGNLWLLLSAPGEGRSALLTQIGAHLACEHQLPTYLIASRDSARVVSARLHANANRIPLGHILDRRLAPDEADRLARHTEELSASALRVAAGPYARHRTAEWLQRRSRQGSIVAVFDDPDWEGEWDLHEARQLADRGAAVIAALPRERLLHTVAGRSEFDAAAALADLVLEIRHQRILASGHLTHETQPGRAVMTVLRNRHGPRYRFTVGFLAHWARYDDLPD